MKTKKGKEMKSVMTNVGLSSRESYKFVVRMHTPGLRDSLANAALANKRSINAEILHRLEAFESAKWNPSIGNLVITPDGDIGTLSRFFYEGGELSADVDLRYDDRAPKQLYFPLSQLKPFFV